MHVPGKCTVYSVLYNTLLSHSSAILSRLTELKSSPSQSGLVSSGQPLLGVGHSMGALLHLLIGSYNIAPTTSNVLISYNNK